MKIIPLVIASVLSISFSMPANAENLAKFIEHYNGIEVRIENDSAECDVVDKELYAETVGTGLQSIGITPNKDALTTAYLFIWATPFGLLNDQCATFMSLRLGSDVSAAVLKLDAKIKGDELLIEKATLVAGTFPAAFHFTSKLFVKWRQNMPKTVLEVIGELVKNVKETRQ